MSAIRRNDTLLSGRRTFRPTVESSRNRRRAALGAATAVALASLVSPARQALAADVTWDNGSSNSVWDTTSANFSGAAWNNLAGDGAFFGAVGSGPVSVPGQVNVDSISFTTFGYTLNGPGPINFVQGSSTWTTGVINVDPTYTATINVPVNSALGFQKIGSGTLELGAPGSYTGAIALDGRAATSCGLLVGGSFGTIDGGMLRILSSSVIPASTDVGFGQGYLDIGSNNLTVRNLTFTNQNPSKAWNAALNANNGVVGSGTLRVTGEINVLGAFGDNSGNTIATDVDLGGGTQVIRIGGGSSFALNQALMFTGKLTNGSLLKTIGYNPNGVFAANDGMSLFGDNTYTGSTVVNMGTNVVTGTNATSSLKVAGPVTPAGSSLNLQGANGSALSATLIQSFAGATFALDNNAAVGAGGFNAPNIPAAQNNNRIRDDVVVEVRDAGFAYRGLATAAATETYGALNVLGGHNILTITPNGAGGTAVLTAAGNLTMAARSTLQVAGTTLGAAGKAFFNGSVPAADATGILPRVWGSSDFLTYNGATGMTPYTGYATDFTTAGTNVAITAATAVASSVNINALKRTNSFTLTINPGQTLGITSGMILNTSGTGTITGGTVAFGPTAGVLVGTNVISSAITGSDGLIMASGTGSLSGDMSGLSGELSIHAATCNLNTNTFSGPIKVRQGSLNLNVSQTGSGLGAITLGVAQNDSNLIGTLPSLSISGAGANAVIARDLIVDNGSTNAAGVPLRYSQYPGLSPLSNTTGSQTWSGNVTLNTSLRLQGGGASSTSTGATNFTGNITGPGTFFIANGRANFSGNYSNAGGFYIGDQGFSAKISFTGVGGGNGTMTISGGNSNTVSYNAGALQGGAINVWNSSPGTAPQIIPLQSSTINNEIRLGIGSKPGQEGDAIANVGAGIVAEWAGPLTGFSSLTKIGTGDLILSNIANTHTGPVAVNAGRLVVNGFLPSSPVNIASTATLAGNGQLGGAVVVASGGSVAPGSSLGTLATGALTIAGDYDAELDLNGGGPPFGADLLDVAGAVTLGGTLDLALLNVPTGDFSGATFLIVRNDSTDPVAGAFASITGLPSGYSASVDYAFTGTDSLGRVGTGNDIAVTVVPEPAGLGLLAGLAGAALLRRRRA